VHARRRNNVDGTFWDGAVWLEGLVGKSWSGKKEACQQLDKVREGHRGLINLTLKSTLLWDLAPIKQGINYIYNTDEYSSQNLVDEVRLSRG
jgi:hypothetical protein